MAEFCIKCARKFGMISDGLNGAACENCGTTKDKEYKIYTYLLLGFVLFALLLPFCLAYFGSFD